MHTEMLIADEPGLNRAAAFLRDGALVAFPTETVYGLGGDARIDHAVASIFEAKQRPQFNPLIVHVADIQTAMDLADWNDNADHLARAFWPGPLTLVLPLKNRSGLSHLVTAGLPDVAIRVPAHPVARALLSKLDGPIAAPSANPSGRISPTTAQHVASGLTGRISAILDGGDCAVGLESTIVGVSGQPTLLRPGGLPAEALEAALGIPIKHRQPDDPLIAPGQMTSHYAPNSRVRLNAKERHPNELLLGLGKMECDLNLSYAGDLTEAAANLFRHLHTLDAQNATTIAISPIPDTGLGKAINDRLLRAAAPKGA